MRSKTTLAAVSVAIFILAAVVAPYAGDPGPSDDACLLLTQAQVTAALGVSVGAGSHMPPKYVRMCYWAQPNSAPPAKSATLMLKTANDFENAKKLMAPITPVSGLGDDAYYAPMGNRMVVLFAKKGNAAFNVTVGGNFPIDQQKAIEKTLASQIASKL